ncbi:uncharacterized protein LOC125267987 isoform X4 [Megalobrama amblycephala]|uniref:uncharacterized protein LOC125267987 isoform X4 n=1 Tax=Megalobrama amblycephala TaxID=75352 RepID=UPI0020140396|nr:uncharacterized protein LOC125267987 isoform X4 [Megalobrama amblycephala]
MRGQNIMSRGSSFQLMQTLRKSPSVFRRCFRQDRTQTLSHGDPLFKVHYLGTEKIYSLDVEQAEEAIGRLLEKSPDMATLGKLGKEHALVVRPRYIERGQQLQCRMFWCNRPDRAKDMTACLARSFQKALNELQEETSHTKGEDREKDGKPIAAMGHSKNSTLTADLRKGQWQRI